MHDIFPSHRKSYIIKLKYACGMLNGNAIEMELWDNHHLIIYIYPTDSIRVISMYLNQFIKHLYLL